IGLRQALHQHQKKYFGPYIQSFYFANNIFERIQNDLCQLFCNRVDEKYYPFAENKYNKQEMLRDLFLWSVYTGRIGTAFVLLLHIKARTGAALLAVALARRKSLLTKEMNQRNEFSDHAEKYEDYAKECINACHAQSEERTSRILLSEKEIYGKATYMQVS
ncbi:unnamed protein product, partial [Rotaria sp. Silwood2]